jgi:tetratricopeptide (TPR) repeat protein
VLLSRRNVLRQYALHFVGEHSPRRDRQIALDLLSQSGSAREANTRLRALWMAATLFRDLREPDLLEGVWVQLEREEWSDLCLEDKAEYALGRALCLYFSGEKERSLETINNIIGELESAGIANSVYLSLTVGLCAIHSGLGDYEAVVPIAERGIRIGRKTGDERRARMLAINLALSHSRLGNAKDQLYWAEWAASQPMTNADLFDYHQIHSIRARAYAVQGRVPESLAALAQGKEALGQHVPPYLQQAWQLRQADVLALLGRGAEALSSAKGGTSGDLSELKSDSFAGLFARWSAKLSVTSASDAESARSKLKALLDRGKLLDRLDRAEVLNAKIWLDSRTGEVNEEERREMWRRLTSLPPGVTSELKQLGMLDL